MTMIRAPQASSMGFVSQGEQNKSSASDEISVLNRIKDKYTKKDLTNMKYLSKRNNWLVSILAMLILLMVAYSFFRNGVNTQNIQESKKLNIEFLFFY